MGEKVEKILLEDGRRAERHVNESDTERVVELHVEAERPLHLQQRLVERKKPIIYERTIETMDDKGQILERKVESLEPNVQMELRSHIARMPSMSDQDEPVTKNELKDAILAALREKDLDRPVPAPAQNPVKFAPKASEEVAARVEQGNTTSWGTIAVWALILAEVGAIGWLWFVQ